MTAVARIATGKEHRYVTWHCPGCEEGHGVPYHGASGPLWHWNGSLETPTIKPSVLVTSFKGEKSYRCHCFVEAGRIRFLSDCTHALAGQTVAMEPE